MGEHDPTTWLDELVRVTRRDMAIIAILRGALVDRPATVRHSYVSDDRTWQQPERAPGWQILRSADDRSLIFPPILLTIPELMAAKSLAERGSASELAHIVGDRLMVAMREPERLGELARLTARMTHAADAICGALGENDRVSIVARRIDETFHRGIPPGFRSQFVEATRWYVFAGALAVPAAFGITVPSQ